MSKGTKYETLSDLAAAFRRGELTHYKLVLDNDSAWLSYTGPLPEGVGKDTDAAYAFMDEKAEECRGWYRGHGYSDLGEACDAAGIPNEWC